VDLGTVSVVDVVNAAMDVVRPTATAKGIDLLFTTDSVCAVYADAGRLQQIVWNLLTNAVKFTPQGGRVSVRISERGGQAVITVSDTGIGIAPDFLPHVFDRFRQADGSLTRGHGGLGLGLSIVKSLVEMHAGSISAQSAGLNQGATFTVTLPAIQQTDETVGSAEQRFAAAGTRAFQSRSILIVDDDVDAGDLAEEILSQRGAQVAVARSAAEGLKLLTELAGIELIVTDLGMPGMDGYEFIKQARAMSVATGTPIPAIALTAHASPQDRARALASGFDVHLAKPFAPGDLLAACASLLDQQRS
jgi:CheY-like chemotaxis protein